MIVRQGTHTCEFCGKQYAWIARKQEKNEVVVGNLVISAPTIFNSLM